MYLYTGYCSGTLWALSGTTPAVSTVIGSISGNPSGFGGDPDGEPWISTMSGRIYRLAPSTGTAPSPFPALLSQTGLFSNTAALTPGPDLQPYEINAAFWSDRASKDRWFKLPAGGEIGFSALDAWRFPVGSATVKHFEITLADGAKHRLETRVFLNTADGWRGASYRWNTAETDANLVTATEQETLEVEVAPGQTREQLWEYPSQANCLRCHTEAAGFVLGLNTPQLNRVAGTPATNQLASFRNEGLFSTSIGAPLQYARLPNPAGTAASLEDRARAYLDVNCSQCHRPGGPTGVNMDLRWATPVADMRTHMVIPAGGDLGISGAKRIRPGSQAYSLVWQRMRRLDGDRMPPVGGHVVHSSGVKLIGDWINAGAH